MLSDSFWHDAMRGAARLTSSLWTTGRKVATSMGADAAKQQALCDNCLDNYRGVETEKIIHISRHSYHL